MTQKITTIAVLTLAPGVLLGLTKAQAEPRQTVLAPVPDRAGWYTTTGPVQFKVGEQILHDGDLPKHLVVALDLEPKARQRAKAKADLPTDGAATTETAAQAVIE